MEKICFVVGLYGKEVNGGAEKHCKMLAERASSLYDVEVLTSITDNYITFKPFYEEGVTVENNVTVRRFSTNAFDRQRFERVYRKSRWGRKIRKFLYKIRILRYISSLFPKFSIALQSELEVIRSHGLYSPDLIRFLIINQANYRAVFLLSYPCPNFYDIIQAIPQKCILIPTAHEEGDFFRSYLSHIFTTVKHVAFNTEAERELCRKIFGNKMASDSILAVGVDNPTPADNGQVKTKFNLPEQYILYCGRVAKEKIGKLIEWFIEYKNNTNLPVKLVLTGGVFMPRCQHPDVIYTGFVTDSERVSLIQLATLVVNPSDRESLSLLLLEAMQLGKPVLVNGKSAVLKQHCIDSGFAAQYYLSKTDFLKKLHHILTFKEAETAEGCREKAVQYIEKNYSWDSVLERLNRLVIRMSHLSQ